MIDRAPKERGLICSAQQVRAILAGTKTQDRRIVKPRPTSQADIGSNGVGFPFIRGEKSILRCPYGQPGDRLYVRETWARDDEDGARFYRADVGSGNEADDWERNRIDGMPRYRWRPSIHMPRWASRITLEITAVRVERLHDISEADAIAEGVAPADEPHPMKWQHYVPHAIAYRRIWDLDHGAGSWDANPWVWVCEFRRMTP